jgi:hypothetical protein
MVMRQSELVEDFYIREWFDRHSMTFALFVILNAVKDLSTYITAVLS